MPLQGQDLLNLCALAAQNEDLIVGVGKMALNIALSPNRAAFDIAKGIAGMVFTGLTANSQRGNSLTPTPSRTTRFAKKKPACEYIQNEMNEAQQERLINRVSNVLGGRDRDGSYRDMLSLVLNNPNMRNKLVGEIKKFLEGENMSCCRGNNCCDDDDDDDDEDDCCDYYNVPGCSRSRSCSKY